MPYSRKLNKTLKYSKQPTNTEMSVYSMETSRRDQLHSLSNLDFNYQLSMFVRPTRLYLMTRKLATHLDARHTDGMWTVEAFYFTYSLACASVLTSLSHLQLLDFLTSVRRRTNLNPNERRGLVAKDMRTVSIPTMLTTATPQTPLSFRTIQICHASVRTCNVTLKPFDKDVSSAYPPLDICMLNLATCQALARNNQGHHRESRSP